MIKKVKKVFSQIGLRVNKHRIGISRQLETDFTVERQRGNIITLGIDCQAGHTPAQKMNTKVVDEPSAETQALRLWMNCQASQVGIMD